MSKPGVVCAASDCPNLRPCPLHADGATKSRGWRWSTITVPAVLERDHHRCTQCNKACPHPKHHDVAHRQDRISGGSDADLSNLVTLCASANRGNGRCK